jgi:hypothetical protein
MWVYFDSFFASQRLVVFLTSPEFRNNKLLRKRIMANDQETQNWPELAISLYDKLTGRDAEISYSFDDFELYVPSSTAADASHARWKMNGTVRIASRNAARNDK